MEDYEFYRDNTQDNDIEDNGLMAEGLTGDINDVISTLIQIRNKYRSKYTSLIIENDAEEGIYLYGKRMETIVEYRKRIKEAKAKELKEGKPNYKYIATSVKIG